MPQMPQAVADAISAALRNNPGFAQAHPNFLPATARIESQFNPDAYNKSGAAGLYQFMPKTAAAFGLSNPYDPNASADAATRLAMANGKTLSGVLGREPTDGELYLAHQQGAGGASKLLSDPSVPAVDVVGRQAVIQNGGRPDMTAGDFANLWISKVDGQSSSPTPTAQAGAFGLNGPTAVGSTGTPFSMTGAVSSDPTSSTSSTLSGSDDSSGLDPMKILQTITGGQGGQGAAGAGGASSGQQAQSGGGMRVQAPRPRPFALMKFNQFGGFGR